MRAGIVGGGVIGGGWAARFLLNGWDVAVHDPAPGAEARIEAVLGNARRALPALYDRALPEEGRLTFAARLAAAAEGADWVQESVPERLEAKRAVLAEIVAAAPEGAVVGSSTSGFTPAELNGGAGRVIVAHPFNPVYLLPLVELVGDGAWTARAAALLEGIGMHPLTVRKEIPAHLADRLLEAVWREALWLVKDGVATTAQIDDAIRYGFGLRWGQMGLFETYRIAGGEAGMRHFLDQFGPTLALPWSRLTDVPAYDDALVELIAGQSDAQSGAASIAELERRRDDNLVGMIRALKRTGSAAGGPVAAHDAALPPPGEAHGLPVTVSRVIPPTWTDYNGHMNETHYMELGAQANDRIMELVGADAAYIAAGQSYFTVENHIRYLGEMRAGQRVRATTQVLAAEGKRLHVFHRLLDDAGTVCATVESLMLHVDLTSRRTSAPGPAVAEKLAAWAEAHGELPLPEGTGRAIAPTR